MYVCGAFIWLVSGPFVVDLAAIAWEYLCAYLILLLLILLKNFHKHFFHFIFIFIFILF